MLNLFRKPSPARAAQRAASTVGLWAIDSRRVYMLTADHKAGTITIGDETPEDDDKPYDVTPGGVAIVDLCGVMLKSVGFWDSLFGGVCSSVDVSQIVQAAAADPEVTSIVIQIDSPGGQVSGTAELAAAVAYAATLKPVVACVQDCCCSAAYWVASQADQIIANATGFIGSIGTYCVLQDTSGLQDKFGVKLTVVSTGEYKGLGADGKVTDKLVADVQREVDGVNAIFLAAVGSGREMSAEDVQIIADGRAWIASDALAKGLIDAVGTMGDALAAAANAVHKQPPVGTRMMSARPKATPAAKAIARPPGPTADHYRQATDEITFNPALTQGFKIDPQNLIQSRANELWRKSQQPVQPAESSKMAETKTAASDNRSATWPELEASWKSDWQKNEGNMRAAWHDEKTYLTHRRYQQQQADQRTGIVR